MNQIVINAKTKEKRIAILSKNRLIDYYIFRENKQAEMGEIYFAQIEKIDKKIEAAFLNIGEEKAFIHLKDIPKESFQTQGSYLLVQIRREGSKKKLPVATGMIEYSSSLMVLITGKHYISVSKRVNEKKRKELITKIAPFLNEDEALILRSEAENKDEKTLQNKLKSLREKHIILKKTANTIKKSRLLISCENRFQNLIHQLKRHYDPVEIITDEKNLLLDTAFYKNSNTIFSDYKIEHQIDKLSQMEVQIPNGSSLFIEKTEAMWVIDVNSSHFSGHSKKSQTIDQINNQAVAEIIRQIRLRNMNGLIVIDFINGMTEEGTKKLIHTIEKAVKSEYITTQFVAFSKTGLMQLTRRKKKKSLLEETSMDCPFCNGSGYVKSATTLAYLLERELLVYRDLILVMITEDVLSHYLDLKVENHLKIKWEIVNSKKPFYKIAPLET